MAIYAAENNHLIEVISRFFFGSGKYQQTYMISVSGDCVYLMIIQKYETVAGVSNMIG